jgi:orotate phosphoribosyltransferase
MKDYQKAFLTFSLEAGVLGFGEFTLKSGRRSPYFFNTGLFNTGERLRRLGEFYAAAIMDSQLPFDMLYGPAYKGIPLVSAAAVALSALHDRDVPFCFNRKEIKDHGEGGNIIGARPAGDVAIIDDVISAGTSVGESVQILNAHGARPTAVFISLDRQERGRESDKSATREVADRFGMPVRAIATLDTLVAFLEEDPAHREHLDSVRAYRAEYGAE